MKSHLVLMVIIIALAADVNYGDTGKAIQCYVCNSIKDQNCDQLLPNNDTHLMDCDKFGAELADQYVETLMAIKKKLGDKYNGWSEYLDSWRNGSRSAQCLKIVMKFDNGEKERVIRKCAGVTCRTRIQDTPCQYSYAPPVKAQYCYCEGDKCNASVRRSHPNNFYLNLLIPIVISINFLLN